MSSLKLWYRNIKNAVSCSGLVNNIQYNNNNEISQKHVPVKTILPRRGTLGSSNKFIDPNLRHVCSHIELKVGRIICQNRKFLLPIKTIGYD